MALRIFFSIILLLSVLFAPFWVTAIVAFLGIIYFPFYIESIVLLLLSDLLYGAPETHVFDIVFVSSGIALIVYMVMQVLKKKLTFYATETKL